MRDYSAAVLTISDKVAWGEQVDTSGPSLVRILEGALLVLPHDFLKVFQCSTSMMMW